MSGKNQPKKVQPVVETPVIEGTTAEQQTDSEATATQQPVEEQSANEIIETPSESITDDLDQTTPDEAGSDEGSGEQNTQPSEIPETELPESTLVTEEASSENTEPEQTQPVDEVAEPTATEVTDAVSGQIPDDLTTSTTRYLEEEGGFEVKTAEGSVIVKPSELPTPELSIVEKQKVIIDEINSEMERLLEGVPSIKRIPFEQIKQYLLEMAPKKPVSIDHGKIQQRVLIGALRTILNQVDDEGTFTQQFTALLKIFHLGQQHALNELYVFRFLEHVEMRNEEIEAYTRIVNMLLITADIKSRKQSLKQLDFEKTLRFGLSDQARRRIVEFYGV